MIFLLIILWVITGLSGWHFVIRRTGGVIGGPDLAMVPGCCLLGPIVWVVAAIFIIRGKL